MERKKGPITSGSVIVEMMRRRPPHSAQARTSMANTRIISSLQGCRRRLLGSVSRSTGLFGGNDWGGFGTT
jgi:hypothetical protein